MKEVNYIFDVVGKRGQAMRGFLDIDSKEIVIYDDKLGKEMFRIGGNVNNKPTDTKKKLTTLTFVISNGSDTKQTATLFGANLEPLIQPLGITVSIREIQGSVFNSHNYIRRDILSNKLSIKGLTYIVQNPNQFSNNLQFGTIKPYGVIETNPFYPYQFLSKNQIATNILDLSKSFDWEVDARSILYVPVEPKSTVTLMFNVLEDTGLPTITNRGYNYGNNYPNNYMKPTPISYSGNTPNLFKNINSGGLGAVNFDGMNEDMNEPKNKVDLFSGFMKVALCVLVAGLAINVINNIKK